MKKTVKTSVVGMMMAAALAAPVHAADVANPTGTMDVTYTEPNNYVISIPSSVILEKGNEVSAPITATIINIEPSYEVQVSINNGIDNGSVTLTREGGSETTTSKVSLTTGGDAIADKAIIATFEGQDTTVTSGGTLYFSALPTDLAAGKWTGTITFSVSVEDITSVNP